MKLVYRYFSIILLLIILTVVSLAGTLFFHVGHSFTRIGEASRESMESTLVYNFIKEGESLAAVLADAMIDPFLVHDRHLFSSLTNALKSIDFVQDVYVYSSDGNILSDGTYSMENYNEPIVSIIPLDDMFSHTSVINQESGLIITTSPVQYDGELLGGVCIVMTSDRIERAISNLDEELHKVERNSYEMLFRAGLGVVIFLLIGAAFLAYWTACRLSEPLKSLSDAMSKVGRGDFQLSLPIERRDEIGSLGRSMLSMARELKNTTISRDFFNGILYGMRDGVIVTDENDNIVIINNAAEILLDSSMTEAVGRSIYDYIDEESYRNFKYEKNTNHKEHGLELKIVPKDGSERHVLVSSSKIKNNEALYKVFILHNITERKKLEDELTFKALHDNLTGLANRHALINRLKVAIARFERDPQRPYAVLFIDLDRFKFINDTLGHNAGDKLLIEISARLKRLTRAEDTVSRLGGDEFIILLNEVEGPDSAAIVADRVLEVIAEPVRLCGENVVVTCSVGLFVSTDSSIDINAVLAKADMAMYEAKKLGRGQFKNYEFDGALTTPEVFHIETGLRKALSNGSLQVFYQPILSVNSDETESVEALARWIHPDHGEIAPDDFIPVAEDAGLICSIFDFVFDEGVAFLKQVELETGRTIRLNINVSAYQITNSTFAASVNEKLIKHSLDPERVTLELTESALISEYDIAKSNIEKLKELGVGLALDDFGTGYSSLTHVLTLPFDYMKIDKTFIFKVHSRNRSSKIFQSILSMGQSLGMRIVAEGVEKVDDLKVIRDRKCDLYQGFLKCKPLPAPEIIEFIKKGGNYPV
ncbi:EAL domain-containing protein [Maridesulfovibrio hydrothermalis]|uniref:Putative Diguanylate cyclase n=1 Tax=Maridesulfovibrio hydrothermalis AM13 = DSM 14728 TaxID=1121451 RepID=L0RFF0_9BACT|nr:EAL domain-containing protein [Maridesulfovibrio hydrothermalis]CCO25474.1 putative Diguanylate cyclase [Maridesulfovibrio hydrothermalis AM13 = DSM 14728]